MGNRKLALKNKMAKDEENVGEKLRKKEFKIRGENGEMKRKRDKMNGSAIGLKRVLFPISDRLPNAYLLRFFVIKNRIFSLSRFLSSFQKDVFEFVR